MSDEPKREPESPAAITLPFKDLSFLDSVALIRGPRYEFDLKNMTGRRVSDEEEQAQLQALAAKLTATDEVDKYRGSCGTAYTSPEHSRGGYITMTILPELTGLPVCNALLAYLDAFKPRAIRIGNEMTCTQSLLGNRITVWTDEHDKVTSIDFGTGVLWGTGFDVRMAVEALKKGEPAPTTVKHVFYTDGTSK